MESIRLPTTSKGREFTVVSFNARYNTKAYRETAVDNRVHSDGNVAQAAYLRQIHYKDNVEEILLDVVKLARIYWAQKLEASSDSES